MACEVSPGPSSAQVFSALTLFECTVTNAQMLVDSMPDRELLRALRIANCLHMHILGVMEPKYERACQRSDEHDGCQRAAATTSASSAASGLAPTPPKVKLQCGLVSDNGVAAAAAVVAKVESQLLGNGAAAAAPPEPEADADEESYYYDDDCLVVEEYDASFSAAAGRLTAAGGSGGAVSPAARKRPRRRLQRRPDSVNGGADVGGVVLGDDPGGRSSSSQGGWVGECKCAIRQAYKEIKGGGPHLFDFSLPFTDPINSQPAEQVIARAMELQPQLDVPPEVWWSQLCPIDLNRLDRSKKLWRQRVLMRRLRSKDSKLVRRQKSFELVASTLSTEAFDKFRVILSRDYTSSDEEAGTGDDEGGGGVAAGAPVPLRVRELAWESAEVKLMKRRLDDAYLESCANARQAEQMRRIERGAGCLSGRAPPPDCPDWAMNL